MPDEHRRVPEHICRNPPVPGVAHGSPCAPTLCCPGSAAAPPCEIREPGRNQTQTDGPANATGPWIAVPIRLWHSAGGDQGQSRTRAKTQPAIRKLRTTTKNLGQVRAPDWSAAKKKRRQRRGQGPGLGAENPSGQAVPSVSTGRSTAKSVCMSRATPSSPTWEVSYHLMPPMRRNQVYW